MKNKEDVVKFLLGEGTLNGVNYGERPGNKPPFWWRIPLREKFEAIQKENLSLKLENEEANDIIISLRKEVQKLRYGVLTEVWQKWCELDSDIKFDEWLHDEMKNKNGNT